MKHVHTHAYIYIYINAHLSSESDGERRLFGAKIIVYAHEATKTVSPAIAICTYAFVRTHLHALLMYVWVCCLIAFCINLSRRHRQIRYIFYTYQILDNGTSVHHRRESADRHIQINLMAALIIR